MDEHLNLQGDLPHSYMFNKYNIKPTDRFNQNQYPEIVQEITQIHRGVAEVHETNKNDIVVSFLKDHCIKTAWLDGNVETTRIMRSGTVTSGHIESLFDSCRYNSGFSNDLEQYIRARLRNYS